MQIHLRALSFLIMISSTQFLWCDHDQTKGITEPAFLSGAVCALNAGCDMTWHEILCRFQKIGDCTSLLEVGKLSFVVCPAGQAQHRPNRCCTCYAG